MKSFAPLALTLPVVLLPILLCLVPAADGEGMFQDWSWALPQGTSQLNYGVAVTNVGEGHGPMEWVVAGFSGSNLVLQYDPRDGRYTNIAEEDPAYAQLRDPDGAAIGVCACDIDGDGLEEIYFLNTNNRYSGPKLVRDRLFKWRNNRYEDLFSDDVNSEVSSMYSGRSVACVDRTGSGKYGFLLATYSQNRQGKFGLIEMNENDPRNNVRSGRIVLHNVAEEVGINFSTGGRGVTVGPIVGDDGFSDIYFVNEGNGRLGNRADNALFVNDGNGYFLNMADELNLNDSQPGRGVTLADLNNDGKTDIVYGNWMGPHRIQIQDESSSGQPTFFNVADADFAKASPIRTVIAADFDNSGTLQVFMNNIVYYNEDASNRLFRVVPSGDSVQVTEEDVGDAVEPFQHGTGAAVADIDQDGVLELMVAHGESEKQGLTFYHVNPSKFGGHNWLRVLPLTQNGAPARGAKVELRLADGTRRSRIIDGGSGYLCEMEPVAHFGIGASTGLRELKVIWPDNHQITKGLTAEDVNAMFTISHTGEMIKAEPATNIAIGVYDTKRGVGDRDSARSQARGRRLQSRERDRFNRGRYRPSSIDHNRSHSPAKSANSMHDHRLSSERNQRRRQRKPATTDTQALRRRQQYGHANTRRATGHDRGSRVDRRTSAGSRITVRTSKPSTYNQDRRQDTHWTRAESERRRQRQHQAELERIRQKQRNYYAEMERKRNVEAERVRMEMERKRNMEAEKERIERQKRRNMEAEKERIERERWRNMEAEKERSERERRRNMEAEKERIDRERKRNMEAEKVRMEMEKKRRTDAERRRIIDMERRRFEADRRREIEMERRRKIDMGNRDAMKRTDTRNRWEIEREAELERNRENARRQFELERRKQSVPPKRPMPVSSRTGDDGRRSRPTVRHSEAERRRIAARRAEESARRAAEQDRRRYPHTDRRAAERERAVTRAPHSNREKEIREYWRRIAQHRRQENARKAEEERRRNSFRRAEIDRGRRTYEEQPRRGYEIPYSPRPKTATTKVPVVSYGDRYRERSKGSNREQYSRRRLRPTQKPRESTWDRRAETSRYRADTGTAVVGKRYHQAAPSQYRSTQTSESSNRMRADRESKHRNPNQELNVRRNYGGSRNEDGSAGKIRSSYSSRPYSSAFHGYTGSEAHYNVRRPSMNMG